MSLCGTPFDLASDFARLPRWSMAAAAMTPFLFESAFMCWILPGEKLTGTLLWFDFGRVNVQLSHVKLYQTAVEAVGDGDITENLRFQGLGRGEAALIT